MEKHLNELQDINRRRFLKKVSALAAIAYVPSFLSETISDKWGSVLPVRKLGKTGLDVTTFCLGGGPYNQNFKEEESIVQSAFDGGCRFFETARAYGTEPAFGNVLRKYRSEIILSSKSGASDADGLNRDLEKSLKALQTSYLDIYLMHAMSSIDIIRKRLDGGVYKAMLKAKEEGKIRHIGFSGHSDFAANNYLLDLNLPELEVMLVPVNVVDCVKNSFTLNTLPKAVEKNIGIMAMKPIGGGGMIGADIKWGKGVGTKRPSVIPDIISMKDAQHFVYSMPISAASYGCTSVAHVAEDISYLKSFTGMSKTQQDDLIKRVTSVAQNNLLEHYKGT
jgi:predicted aldo/keto reductase-like oxidoreductase